MVFYDSPALLGGAIDTVGAALYLSGQAASNGIRGDYDWSNFFLGGESNLNSDGTTKKDWGFVNAYMANSGPDENQFKADEQLANLCQIEIQDVQKKTANVVEINYAQSQTSAETASKAAADAYKYFQDTSRAL